MRKLPAFHQRKFSCLLGHLARGKGPGDELNWISEPY